MFPVHLQNYMICLILLFNPYSPTLKFLISYYINFVTYLFYLTLHHYMLNSLKTDDTISNIISEKITIILI